MQPRPFRILGIQQIALGHEDRSVLEHLWIDLLGLVPGHTYRAERENVDEVITRTGVEPWAVEIDLMQPIDPDRAPRVHQPALNHLGLWVDRLDDAVAWLQGRGVRFAPGGIRPGASGHRVCFIHPRGSEDAPVGGAGVLIELVEAPGSLVRAWDEAMGTAG
jgi:lactoylglutathione lyase